MKAVVAACRGEGGRELRTFAQIGNAEAGPPTRSPEWAACTALAAWVYSEKYWSNDQCRSASLYTWQARGDVPGHPQGQLA